MNAMRTLRLLLGLCVMSVNTTLCMLICALLLPFRIARIKTCNIYGKLTGPIMMKVAGCPVTIVGGEHLDPDRPAIYVSNHTSIVDGFLAMYLAPLGTVGVVKKEVVYYPFFGQMYLLSGHLRIDRGRSEKARESLAALASFVRENKLSIYLWPEGTRSRSGRLMPFKKGLLHLAMQTGLPVVPIVVEGATEAWVKGSLLLNPVPITVTVHPAIDTSAWSKEDPVGSLTGVWECFANTLPERQKPEPGAQAA